MTLFYCECIKIGIYWLFIFLIFLFLLVILLSYSFSTLNPDSGKFFAYEDARFYLVAIFFIIFDLEAIFFLPRYFDALYWIITNSTIILVLIFCFILLLFSNSLKKKNFAFSIFLFFFLFNFKFVLCSIETYQDLLFS